ncbi:MAG: phosphatase PAP2 family protein, partial [Candidatus Nanoarchaeia archaeon]
MRNRLIIGIFVAVAAAAVSFLIDERIVLLFYLARNSAMNFAMRLVSSGVIMVALFCLLFVFAIFKKRALSFLCASAGSLFVVELLKMIVARQRPMVEVLVSAVGSSWPSSHAAFAFGIAAVLCKAAPNYRLLWIVIACVVGFSRLWVGAHYLSDVVSGALIGYCIGLLAVRIEEKYG